MNSPWPGSDFHGGMKRLFVTAAIWVARCLAEGYVSRLNGAAPPGRWHIPQASKMIGAMSAKLTGAAGTGGTAVAPCEATVPVVGAVPSAIAATASGRMGVLAPLFPDEPCGPFALGTRNGGEIVDVEKLRSDK